MKISKAYAVLGIFFLLAVIHLSLWTHTLSLNYKIAEQKAMYAKVKSENRGLKYLVAKESSLQKIDNAAKGKLNMEYPAKMNYIIVSTTEATPQ